MPTLHIETPLLDSRPLARLAGRPIRLKLEALQPSGSFKLRGIGHACTEYVRRGAQRLVSSSGGNAGIATSLGARQVCEQAFDWTRHHEIRSQVVSDRQAVGACLRFMDDHRLVVEPACGAALAVIYSHAERLGDFDSVLVILCGGATASVDRLQHWSATRPG